MRCFKSRDEESGLLPSVREAITIGKEGGIPIVLTHHKAVGKPNWGSSVRSLAMVDSGREAGVDVMLDQYPYGGQLHGHSNTHPILDAGRGE